MTTSAILVEGGAGCPHVLMSSCSNLAATTVGISSRIFSHISLSSHLAQLVSSPQALHRNITPCTLIPPHIHHTNTTRTTYPSHIPQSCLTGRVRIDIGDVGPTRAATGPTRGATIGVDLPAPQEAMTGVDLPAPLEATAPALTRRECEGVTQSLTATRGRCRLHLPSHLVAPGTLRAGETLVSIFRRRPAEMCRQHRNLARLRRASL